MDEDDITRRLKISPNAERGWHNREKNSFRGIATRTNLRALTAGSVNQDYLDEICELTQLEELDLLYPMTATSLDGLVRLQNLKRLRIDSPRNIEDFSPITRLMNLDELEIENAKHLFNLRWMLPLKDRLRKLGLDGSINTTQKLESLDPLDGFAFEELTLTTVSLKDKDISPLINCRSLKSLRCATTVSTFDGFMALADARPDIECMWFDLANWPGRKKR